MPFTTSPIVIARRAFSSFSSSSSSFSSSSSSSSTPHILLNPLSPQTVTHLIRHGFAIQDNVLPPHHIAPLLTEIRYLIDNSHTTPNHTHILRASNPPLTFSKHSVLQAQLPNIPPHIPIPHLRALHHDPSLPALLNVLWPRLTIRSQSLKLQRSSSALGCFPLHLDSSPRADQRILTALLYPHEQATHHPPSGALRLFPTPLTHVDVSPAPARLVLLSSTLMHHRVLPAHHHRYAITLWLSGSLRAPITPSPPMFDSLAAHVAYCLLHPSLRDFAFRLALQTQWEASFAESHAPLQAQQLVHNFRSDVSALRQQLPMLLRRKFALDDTCSSLTIDSLLHSQRSVMSCFQALHHALGHIPFIW